MMPTNNKEIKCAAKELAHNWYLFLLQISPSSLYDFSVHPPSVIAAIAEGWCCGCTRGNKKIVVDSCHSRLPVTRVCNYFSPFSLLCLADEYLRKSKFNDLIWLIKVSELCCGFESSVAGESLRRGDGATCQWQISQGWTVGL